MFLLPDLSPSPVLGKIAVKLKNKALASVRNGDFRIYETSIEHLSKKGCAGETAVLFDKKQKFAGAGLYDPYSPVAVKVLTNSPKLPPVGKELFHYRIREALALRTGKLPPETDGYRLLHGESDFFPGLVADQYGESLVLKIYSSIWFPFLPMLADLLKEELPHLENCVVRLSREMALLPEEVRYGFTDGAAFCKGKPAPDWEAKVLFRENGITFEADLIRGQKTGFFLDQRDNRFKVSTLARGKKLLNLFSYSGGFSLSAAKGGAKEVWDVDFSKYAIAESERNFARNLNFSSVKHCLHKGITGDAFEVMTELGKKGELFDMVIIDPPSFAKSSAEKEKALYSYGMLAKLGAALLRKGGIMVFASCSSRVRAEDLFPHIEEILTKNGYRREVFCETEHAIDHPARFPESKYLKCQYARIF